MDLYAMRRWLAPAALAGVLVLAAAGYTMAEPPTVYPGTDWEQATPDSQGGHSAKLKSALNYLEQNADSDGIHELLVMRNGRMFWHGDNIDKVHGIWSCTKSFSSTVLGVLLDEEKCELTTGARPVFSI